MDFFRPKIKECKDFVEVYPDFKICHSEDLMVRGGSFYAIWDEAKSMWSTDEFDVARLVDEELSDFSRSVVNEKEVVVRWMANFASRSWFEFKRYLKSMPDSFHQLDANLSFANMKLSKKDYASKKLPYSLEKGKCDSFERIIGELYDPSEREKLEWAIGSIIAGDSKDIQKFIVLYGSAGAGKSTILNIIEMLFQGYCVNFEAKALTSLSNAFSTEVFKSNPIVALQHDGDLSRIEDNTKLNSIVSHENMIVNEKYKSSYSTRINCFLFMGTNQPVKITDAKSGILRRLIDVHPSGRRIPFEEYTVLMDRIKFELGSIASHCLKVYRKLGINYYDNYRPLDMMFKTNPFFNFVEDSYLVFKRDDCTTLKAAYLMYKEYCNESNTDYKLPMYRFREELKNYFADFKDDGRIDGKHVRSLYSGFLASKFENATKKSSESKSRPQIGLESLSSVFDKECRDCFAQYANENETPVQKWANVKTKLSDIDTSKIHYVRVPENHIVIDFDIKGEDGEKSFEKNLEEASKWPPTYCETSKSGKGIHLHYIYDGDPSKLSRVYSDGIEIKVFNGNSSLRRKLTKCNDLPIAHISTGLPLKGEKVVNFDAVKSEKSLRNLILRNLRKEIHPGTKPSVDFIFKILEDAYKSGLHYDVTDMRQKILSFAVNSTHHSEYCVSLVSKMKFHSDEPSDSLDDYVDDDLVFFDVEVFPNLFVVVWKKEDKPCIQWINPTSTQIEELLRHRLVGFNNRRYDNHILYARLIGYDNHQLYETSKKIIDGSKNSMFREAYNLSYADIYDYSSKKQSLKKFEIELGIHHQELGLKWDEEVPEDLWVKVADYCINDVVATEAVFKARKQDFVARHILSDLSGLPVNATTQQHAAKIIFGNDPNPQEKFIYTDLSEEFPGYSFKEGHSYYMGEDPKEGGYVYSEPGFWGNVALLDIASMHPSTIINLNLFGPYTKNFKEIVDARLAIKHKEFDKAKKMLGGKLAKYLVDEKDSDDLAYALKIVINIVYGLTSAKFDNKFRDIRNKDNIVAKRGALFMINLKHEVQKRGYKVAHIKTDSIKIPDADEEIIKFVVGYGKQYGYNFEHEATYNKMCLVNDAVYIAKYKDGKHAGEWTATGSQFQHPYVFKTLFSKEPIEFKDLCETKTVTSALYLDMNETLGEDEHNYIFVGKAGSFCPIKPGCGGGLLMREKDGKYYAATATKGFRWLEAEMVQQLGKEDDIDRRYQNNLVDAAVKEISKYTDFEWFSSDDEYVTIPWK